MMTESDAPFTKLLQNSYFKQKEKKIENKQTEAKVISIAYSKYIKKNRRIRASMKDNAITSDSMKNAMTFDTLMALP